MFRIILWVIILLYIVISTTPEMIFIYLLSIPVGFLLLDTETLSACIKKFFRKTLRKITKKIKQS